jgi:hypothetical protein
MTQTLTPAKPAVSDSFFDIDDILGDALAPSPKPAEEKKADAVVSADPAAVQFSKRLRAPATRVSIDIVDGGLQKIVVTDNGVGMSQEDIQECFKLHTTSKIMPADDLTAIRSMGFRGEALASIASISHLTIQSRQEDNPAGTKVTLNMRCLSIQRIFNQLFDGKSGFLNYFAGGYFGNLRRRKLVNGFHSFFLCCTFLEKYQKHALQESRAKKFTPFKGG